MEMWISNWPPKTKTLFSWPDGYIRVAEVKWLINDKVITKLDGDPKQPCRGSRTSFPNRFTSKENGTFKIKAVAKLVNPDGSSVFVNSNQATITINHIMTPQLTTWCSDSAQNLLNPNRRKSKLTTRASSSSNGHGPAKAVDHFHCTKWLRNKKEKGPAWLEIELTRRLRADTLILTPAIWNPTEPRAYDLPQRVLVQVGSRKFTANLPASPTKTTINFGRVLPVKGIRITIEDWHPGKRYKGQGGLAEIELQNSQLREKD